MGPEVKRTKVWLKCQLINLVCIYTRSDSDLLDVGGDHVLLAVEGDDVVLALNDGGFDEELVSGSADVVLGHSAALQELLLKRTKYKMLLIA